MIRTIHHLGAWAGLHANIETLVGNAVEHATHRLLPGMQGLHSLRGLKVLQLCYNQLASLESLGRITALEVGVQQDACNSPCGHRRVYMTNLHGLAAHPLRCGSLICYLMTLAQVEECTYVHCVQNGSTGIVQPDCSLQCH